MASMISVDTIEDGMILAEPIINNFGQTLLPAGVSLSKKHKLVLKTWNIQTVCVKADAEEEEIGISEELKALAEEKINSRLLWQPSLKVEKDLYSASVLLAAKKIIEKNQDY